MSASRSIDGSTDPFGGSCTRTFYTTDRLCTTPRRRPRISPGAMARTAVMGDRADLITAFGAARRYRRTRVDARNPQRPAENGLNTICAARAKPL
jgi:hypothetical protein